MSTATPAAPQKRKPAPPPVLFTFRAETDTWIKKRLAQASEVPDDEKVRIEKGRTLQVVETTEVPANAHEWITLAHDAGRWFAYAPHFRRLQEATAPPLTPEDINWSNFDQKIHPFLTVGEVLQFDRRRIPTTTREKRRILITAEKQRRLRVAYGRPLGITSWFRPEPINRQVGGVAGSHHTTGGAFDTYPIGGGDDDFYRWARARWTGGLGDGRWRGFTHFDDNGGPGDFVPGAGARPAREWIY